MKIETRKLLYGLFLIAAIAASRGMATAQMAAIAAVDEPEPAEASGSVSTAGGGRSASRGSAKSAAQGKKAAASAKKPKTAMLSKERVSTPPPSALNGPILGDKYTFLNFVVASAEKPYYTRAAKASGAKGLVQVEVLVGTDGSVVSATPRTGNRELWPEAERAARASKFNRPKADGRPARALGFLVYRFGPAED